jgi:hypothetical protein
MLWSLQLAKRKMNKKKRKPFASSFLFSKFFRLKNRALESSH